MPVFSFRRFLLLVACMVAFVAAVSTRAAQMDARRKTNDAATVAATRSTPKRAIVEGVAVPVQALRITDLQGRDISAQVSARTENGKLTLDLAQPSAVVLKSNIIETIKAPRNTKIVLPGGAVVPITGSAPSAPELTDKAIWFRLTLAASPMPAPWDQKEGSYLTYLTFGLKRPDGAPSSVSLDQPVIIKLAYKGLVAPETAMISLDAPGLTNEKTIPLRFTPQSQNPTILVRSSISDVDLELDALPRLAVFSERTKMLGLGLDAAAVTVTTVHPDGRSAPVERSTPIHVTVDGGARIEPASLSFAPGEATSGFVIRSSGLGPITILANADGVMGVGLINQTFPTGPLIAALIGGALGGFARRFIKGSRRAADKRRVIEGVVVSSIAFVAGVLGVGYLNLPSAMVATEAGAFLTGALGGFAGVTVLELLTKKTTKPVET